MKRLPLLVLAFLILSGCGPGWHRVDADTPHQLPPDDQVQVFGRAGEQRWHGVRISADSLSGIRWLEPLECDSCRVTLPRSEIDSIRVGHPVAGFWKGVGIVFAVPVVACAIVVILSDGQTCLPVD